MSLNWDTTRCTNPEPTNETEQNWRECLIWGSISIDIGEITDENIDECLFRYRFLERIDMGIFNTPASREMIERWSGLRTNVLTLPRAKWISKITKHLAAKVEQEMQVQVQV